MTRTYRPPERPGTTTDPDTFRSRLQQARAELAGHQQREKGEQPTMSQNLADRLGGSTSTGSNGTFDEDRDFAPGWAPEVGDKLRGTVVNMAWVIVANRDGKVPCLTMIPEAGQSVKLYRKPGDTDTPESIDADGSAEIAVMAFHTALFNSLKREEVVIDDVVSIQYLGMKEPKGGGKPYHNWVVRKKQDPKAFWGAPAPKADGWDDEPADF